MPRFRVTLKNYRGISDEAPATFQIGGGVVAFIGPNNSGKSSILKLFYELRQLFRHLTDLEYLRNFVLGNAIQIQPQGVEDPIEIFHNRNSRPVSIRIEVQGPGTAYVSELHFQLDRARPIDWKAEVFATIDGHRRLLTGVSSQGLPHFTAEGLLNVVQIDNSEMKSVGELVVHSLYIGPYRNAISEGGGNYYDLAIGTSFISLWNGWKTGGSRSDNEAAQRVTDDIAKIFEYDRLEINAAVNTPTLQVVADGKYYRLRELGAGLAQFIIVFGNALTRRPSLILIDEPELNLHPSLQIDFLLSLSSYASDGLVYSSHSIGLARSTADLLYSCRRVDGHSVVRAFEQTLGLAEFLGEMSFSSFKELGHDTVLLVEGVTEVKAVQQLLRLLGRDHEVIVLPMGGDQFIRGGRTAELAELQRLTTNVAVLIDSERQAANAPLSPHRAAFLSECSALGYATYATALRAFENYFPERAIQSVYGQSYRALMAFEKLGAQGSNWPKSENWRIAREMSKDELLSSDLGSHLNSLP
jgi:hypothetical protein